MEKLLTTQEAAEIIGIAERTLTDWRYSKNPKAPPYLKVGRVIRYRVQDLSEWVDKHTICDRDIINEAS